MKIRVLESDRDYRKDAWDLTANILNNHRKNGRLLATIGGLPVDKGSSLIVELELSGGSRDEVKELFESEGYVFIRSWAETLDGWHSSYCKFELPKSVLERY